QEEEPVLTLKVADQEAVKPKAKRASRVKKETVVEQVDEQPTVIESPTKSSKENTKVECLDGGKSMSAKTLRYSHGPNCLFKKSNR
ncbi:MAG: hypothetical protein ACKPKO_13340, partial [Candidatus Fonsibacter sp.]